MTLCELHGCYYCYCCSSTVLHMMLWRRKAQSYSQDRGRLDWTEFGLYLHPQQIRRVFMSLTFYLCVFSLYFSGSSRCSAFLWLHEHKYLQAAQTAHLWMWLNLFAPQWTGTLFFYTYGHTYHTFLATLCGPLLFSWFRLGTSSQIGGQLILHHTMIFWSSVYCAYNFPSSHPFLFQHGSGFHEAWFIKKCFFWIGQQRTIFIVL